MLRSCIVLVLAILVTLGSGCAGPPDMSSPSQAHPAQRYTLDAVRARLDRLRPGMQKFEVMIALGSPAQQTNSQWVYLPERTGLLIPSSALVIDFERGLYISHRFQSIVLGERM